MMTMAPGSPSRTLATSVSDRMPAESRLASLKSKYTVRENTPRAGAGAACWGETRAVTATDVLRPATAATAGFSVSLKPGVAGEASVSWATNNTALPQPPSHNDRSNHISA